ncbi:MAG TPA: hypothetical protein VGG39_11240 [Polyangiaceae bacterium]
MKLTRSLAKLAFWPVVLTAVSASAQQAPGTDVSSTTSSGYAIAFPALTTPNLSAVVSNLAAMPANFIAGQGAGSGTGTTSSAGGGIGPVAGTATGSTGATSSLGGSIGGVGSAPGGLGSSSSAGSSTSGFGAAATPSGPVYIDVPGMGPGETL